MRQWIVVSVAVVAFIGFFLFLYFLTRPTSFKPSTVQTKGTVLVNGRPRAGVRVTYHPQFDIGPVKFTPNGMTNAQGNFTLSSGQPGDGAPPGEYLVTFDFPVLRSGGIEEEVDLFKGKYSSPEKSKWRVKVAQDSQETFNLD